MALVLGFELDRHQKCLSSMLVWCFILNLKTNRECIDHSLKPALNRVDEWFLMTRVDYDSDHCSPVSTVEAPSKINSTNLFRKITFNVRPHLSVRNEVYIEWGGAIDINIRSESPP